MSTPKREFVKIWKPACHSERENGSAADLSGSSSQCQSNLRIRMRNPFADASRARRAACKHPPLPGENTLARGDFPVRAFSSLTIASAVQMDFFALAQRTTYSFQSPFAALDARYKRPGRETLRVINESNYKRPKPSIATCSTEKAANEQLARSTTLWLKIPIRAFHTPFDCRLCLPSKKSGL